MNRRPKTDPMWTYPGSSADPDTTLDKVVRNGERELSALEADGLPEIRGVGSLKYRQHHQPLPNHIHRDAIEIHLCRAGAARFEIEGVFRDVMPGYICLTQPGISHHLDTVRNRQEHYWMLVQVRRLPKDGFLGLPVRESRALLRRLKELGTNVFPAAGALEGLFHAVCETLDVHPRGPERTLRLRTLCLHLLLAIIDSSERNDPLAVSPKLLAVIDGIRLHPSDDTAVSDLARQAGMSESHFISAFKKATGQPPGFFRTTMRIEAAKRLLTQTTDPIVSIGLQLGFSSAAHFSTAFKHETGQTPQAWRKSASPAERT